MTYTKSNKLFQCNKCLKTFTSKHSCLRHMSGKKCFHYKEEKKIFQCSHCLLNFKKKFALMTHITQDVCKNKKNAKCFIENCNVYFRKREYLSEHLKSAHKENFIFQGSDLNWKNMEIESYKFTNEIEFQYWLELMSQEYNCNYFISSHKLYRDFIVYKIYRCQHDKRLYKSNNKHQKRLLNENYFCPSRVCCKIMNDFISVTYYKSHNHKPIVDTKRKQLAYTRSYNKIVNESNEEYVQEEYTTDDHEVIISHEHNVTTSQTTDRKYHVYSESDVEDTEPHVMDTEENIQSQCNEMNQHDKHINKFNIKQETAVINIENNEDRTEFLKQNETKYSRINNLIKNIKFHSPEYQTQCDDENKSIMNQDHTQSVKPIQTGNDNKEGINKNSKLKITKIHEKFNSVLIQSGEISNTNNLLNSHISKEHGVSSTCEDILPDVGAFQCEGSITQINNKEIRLNISELFSNILNYIESCDQSEFLMKINDELEGLLDKCKTNGRRNSESF